MTSYTWQTKTSCRNANVDAVHFRHHQVALLLKTWLSTADKDGFLVPDSSTKFNSWFSQALKESGLHSVGYRPSSLRRRGATYIFGEAVKPNLIQRWPNTAAGDLSKRFVFI